MNQEVSVSSECPYNTVRHPCDVQIECMVLEESVNEAYEVYEEMRDENQSLSDLIQLLKDIMLYYGIGLPPED